MIKKLLYTGLLTLLVASLAACSSSSKEQEQTSSAAPVSSFDPVVLRVEGFAAPGEADTRINEQQRRLMAMRASRMDAYRALAERVYGTRIQGSTTVQNLAARDDSIRGFVDNLVRGAKVISTTQNDDGTYITTMELVLDPRSQACMTDSAAMSADPRCMRDSIHGEHPRQNMPAPGQQPRTRYHVN